MSKVRISRTVQAEVGDYDRDRTTLGEVAEWVEAARKAGVPDDAMVAIGDTFGRQQTPFRLYLTWAEAL